MTAYYAMAAELVAVRAALQEATRGKNLSPCTAPLTDHSPSSQVPTINEACRHSAFLADVRPTSLSGSTSTKGPPPVATLIYTLTALMAQFWPKTLPTSDESSHCLDTGCAPDDVLGKVDAARSTNITELPSPVLLGTASSSIPLTHTGDAVLSNGLSSSGSFLLGTLSKSLVSLSKRVRQGWGYFGIGRRLLLFSPAGQIYPYMDNDTGLLTPATTAVSDLVPHSLPKALTASSAEPEVDLTPVASPVRPRRKSAVGLPPSPLLAPTFDKGKLSWVTLLTLALALGVMAGTGNVLQPLQLIAAMQGLKTMGPKAAPKHPRVKAPSPLSMAEHCKRGHVPHWPDCDTCCRSRMRGPPAPDHGHDHQVAGSDRGYVLSFDITGPHTGDNDGNFWALHAVETGHTQYGFTRLMKDKSSATVTHAIDSILLELQHAGPDPLPVVRLHSDSDPSFLGELEAYCTKAGIPMTNTGGHRPAANGRVEKRIGLCTYSARGLLETATGGYKYYEALWGAAILYANFCVNAAPFSDGRPAPHTKRTGLDCDFEKRHIFGAKATAWTKPVHRQSKFDLPGRECIWVGKSTVTPGADRVIPITWDGPASRYILHPTIEVVGCTVDNTQFPLRSGPDYCPSEADAVTFDAFMEQFRYRPYGSVLDSSYQIDGEDPILEVKRIKDKRGKGNKVQYLVEWAGVNPTTGKAHLDSWEPAKHLKSARQSIKDYEQKHGRKTALQRSALGLYALGTGALLGCIATLTPNVPIAPYSASDPFLRPALASLIIRERVPGTVNDWMAAYQDELRAVTKKRLTPLTADEIASIPKGQAVRMRMRLVRKKCGRLKARLIVQGFREPRSWDVGGTDAPTASLSTIRTLLFMGGSAGDVISSIDVSTAFLQADLYPTEAAPRYVYYQEGNLPRQYYRLRGCLYGQRTAPKEWFVTLSNWLFSQGFVQGQNDPCAFVHPITKLKLATVVDDILCRGSATASAAFYSALRAKFEVTDPDFLTPQNKLTYVGLDISMVQHKDGSTYICLDQEDDLSAYLDEIPELKDYRVVSNPMRNQYAMYQDSRPLNPEAASWYRTHCGTLNYYASAMRYDIAYATSRLSQFNTRPTEGSKAALLRVLGYLKGTTAFSICGRFSSAPDTVRIYSDSDHGGLRFVDGRSQSGLIVLLNDVPVYWRSNKQVSVSTSSACAEIYALSDAVKHGRLYQWRSQELGMHLPNPLTVHVDNMQAVAFSRDTVLNSKLRGIFDLRADWVAELKDKLELRVEHVDSVNNPADLVTKAHPQSRFQQLLGLIGHKRTKQVTMDIHHKAFLASAVAA